MAHATPDPDLFLAAAERMGVDISDAVVVGDSVWTCWLRGERARGGGLLACGYGREELERSTLARAIAHPKDRHSGATSVEDPRGSSCGNNYLSDCVAASE